MSLGSDKVGRGTKDAHQKSFTDNLETCWMLLRIKSQIKALQRNNERWISMNRYKYACFK